MVEPVVVAHALGRSVDRETVAAVVDRLASLSRPIREWATATVVDPGAVTPWPTGAAGTDLDLLALRYLVAGTGAVRASLVVRRAACAAPPTLTAPSDVALSRLLVSLDGGEFDAARRAIGDIRAAGVSADWPATPERILDLLAGRRDEDADVSEFDRFVRGRRVTVVGPAGDAPEPALDEDSLVVRMAHGARRPDETGSADDRRADVSYFNTAKSEMLLDGRLGWPDAETWVVLKGVRSPDRPRTRTLRGASALAVSGSHLLVPLAVLDLLASAPASVHVTTTTFYVSGQSYDPRYLVVELRPDQTHVRALAQHDPFTGRHLLQHLRAAGLMTTDEATGAVLDLDDDAFAARLDPTR